ncbi:MAG TPA: DHA2 family efflux MFS transporter permease subunit, partial [Gammaproteobacteria bacterium]|nr:DHA2 family efflux MFS transporter permease subunit [Gammaproteobacteria bacterium]
GMSVDLTEMVLFRLLQGVFGAALVPLSQAVLLDSFPREKHGTAMALWGMGIMLGPILGPTLGGYLTEYYNWRWVFFINLPVGILAFLLIAGFVPEKKGERDRPFDWFGFLMLSLGIGALQLMLDRGQSEDWFASGMIIGTAVAAAAGFYLYLAHAFTARHPFLDPDLLRDRNFTMGLVFIFVVGIILLATLALLPPFLQDLMGYPVVTTGLVLAPRGVGTMVAMFLVGRLVNRVDPRGLIAFGLVLAIYSLYWMAQFNLQVSMEEVVWSGVIQGLGLGFIFVPLSTITFATLSPELRTEAAGIFSLVRNVGSSIGISVVITLLGYNHQVSHAALAARVTPFNPAFRTGAVPPAWDPHHLTGLLALDGEINRQAAMIAFLDDFRFLAVVTVVALPLVLLMRHPHKQMEAAPVE